MGLSLSKKDGVGEQNGKRSEDAKVEVIINDDDALRYYSLSNAQACAAWPRCEFVGALLAKVSHNTDNKFKAVREHCCLLLKDVGVACIIVKYLGM